jgi:hypothetical protein
MTRRLVRVLFALVAAARTPAAAADLWVYDNALVNGFQDWSWAERDLAATGVVHSSPNAIEWQPDAWEGIYFHSDATHEADDYLALRFWVRGVGSGGQQVRVFVSLSSSALVNVDLDTYVTGNSISASEWREVVIPLAAVGLPSGAFNEITLQADTGGDQAAVRVDDIRFTEDTSPPQPPSVVTVSVDPALDRRAISDLVYGVNFASAAQLADVGYTLNRWGGNRTTRYNWQLDVDNSAFDWFYTNYTGSGTESQLPATSGADQFLLANRAAHADSVLTLPTIGRVAGPDRSRKWGFSVSDYGPQLATECTATNNAPWCQPDAGNGLCSGGPNCEDGRIVGNDPNDTTMEIQPSFLAGWVNFAVSRIGTAERGGLRFVALDNEPMLWNSTHADIHPEPATYDEVWEKGLAVALAAKGVDDDVKVLGPDTWGWCDLWTSAYDAAIGPSCIEGPDREDHGGLPFVAWILQQSCAHQTAHGVRPIDVLDVHYYPQSGEAFGGEAYAGIRLQSIRELWDATYVSQSWIGDEVFLIPRLKAWIAQYCAGTGLALTEYSWGADAAPSGALAQAEALAIFGREGLDLATRWVVPETGSKTEEAFRLFLDYDGAGAEAFGDRVRAVSAAPNDVGAYAIRGHSDQLYVFLFNKATTGREARVTISGALSGGFQLYRFTPTTALGTAGSATPAAGMLTLVLPPRSATLAVGRIASTLVFADRFETLTARGWSAIVP